MARYRMAVRYGAPRQHYHMADLEADSLADALRRAVAEVTPEVDRSADLVEIRLLTEQDQGGDPGT